MLLDVGCGTGRFLAYFLQMGYPGKAVGLELDEDIAERCRNWSRSFRNVTVYSGNVLELGLLSYSIFYLFNPFDDTTLVLFLRKVEAEATGPVTVCHMSDNGCDSFFEKERGWTLQRDGFFE